MPSVSKHHRLAVASRAVAAILGGYVLTALATATIAVFLPLLPAEASLAATMLSFALYACIVLWVFATRSARRAWAGIALSALVLAALLWLHRMVVGI
jgi:Protein of unknown function (DUF3649)